MTNKKKMKLSENFKLSEFVTSAKHPNIPNNPPPEAVDNIRRLVANILDPARKGISMPIVVTSGYRSQALNRAVGGSATSQHIKGEAADIICNDNARLFNFIRENAVFDQLIWEHGTDKYPAWVHVSLKEQGNRNEVLKAVKENGKTKYIRL